MAKPIYINDGYYETNPDAVKNGPGIPPKIGFRPTTPLAEQLVREGSFIGLRYYLHPKLRDTYRYKYTWKGSKWWIDITFDGLAYHLWKDDGQAFIETEKSANAARQAADEAEAAPPAPEPDAGNAE